MKNRIRFLALLMGSLLVLPVSAWAAEETATAEDTTDTEIVEIVDEDVPLAAIPMAQVEQHNIRPEYFTIAGASMMACACIGFFIKYKKSHQVA